MTRFDRARGTMTAFRAARSTKDDSRDWFDVTVLVENELTDTSARRLIELYPLKRTPLRYHLVRPFGGASAPVGNARPEAERLMQKSVERMEALQATVTGAVSDQNPVEALSDVVTATHSQEVVVVTGQHRLAALLHRDLASQVRSCVELPLVHIVDS